VVLQATKGQGKEEERSEKSKGNDDHYGQKDSKPGCQGRRSMDMSERCGWIIDYFISSCMTCPYKQDKQANKRQRARKERKIKETRIRNARDARYDTHTNSKREARG
jgi:hypothetical protein